MSASQPAYPVRWTPPAVLSRRGKTAPTQLADAQHPPAAPVHRTASHYPPLNCTPPPTPAWDQFSRIFPPLVRAATVGRRSARGRQPRSPRSFRAAPRRAARRHGGRRCGCGGRGPGSWVSAVCTPADCSWSVCSRRGYRELAGHDGHPGCHPA